MMEKSIFEQMGGTYYQQGDYLLPDLTVPEIVPIGIWGQRYLSHLRKRHQAVCTAMLLSGELESCLSEIDQQAEDMLSPLVNQMAEREGITEQLKADSQMEWVGMMNNIRSVVMAIIDREVLCF